LHVAHVAATTAAAAAGAFAQAATVFQTFTVAMRITGWRTAAVMAWRLRRNFWHAGPERSKRKYSSERNGVRIAKHKSSPNGGNFSGGPPSRLRISSMQALRGNWQL
jgi:hypothetical protein